MLCKLTLKLIYLIKFPRNGIIYKTQSKFIPNLQYILKSPGQQCRYLPRKDDYRPL